MVQIVNAAQYTVCIKLNRAFQLETKSQRCIILLHLPWFDTMNSVSYVLLESIDLMLLGGHKRL